MWHRKANSSADREKGVNHLLLVGAWKACMLYIHSFWYKTVLLTWYCWVKTEWILGKGSGLSLLYIAGIISLLSLMDLHYNFLLSPVVNNLSHVPSALMNPLWKAREYNVSLLMGWPDYQTELPFHFTSLIQSDTVFMFSGFCLGGDLILFSIAITTQ